MLLVQINIEYISNLIIRHNKIGVKKPYFCLQKILIIAESALFSVSQRFYSQS